MSYSKSLNLPIKGRPTAVIHFKALENSSGDGNKMVCCVSVTPLFKRRLIYKPIVSFGKYIQYNMGV